MSDEEEEIHEYVQENKDLLARVLAYGDAESRSYALAVLANGGSVNDIEKIQRTLEDLKCDVK